ncbi:MAG: sugar kinase [Candidatus Aenigmatarchaeota archaeon]|nr:MAG: sugar kinase [Candidatus Aenigmarchaeota archaeon]
MKTNNSNVTIVGSVALDSIKTPFGEKKESLGGAASYACVAASLFAKPAMIGVVGSDLPKEHMDLFKSKGIDLSGLTVADGKTFRWGGYYEYDMNQAHTTNTELNVFADFKPKLSQEHKNTKFLFLANILPSLQLDVLDQMEGNPFVAMDTMNLWIENNKSEVIKIIKRTNLVLMNDAEARQLCDTPNLVLAAKKILKHGPNAVIIKKGEHGAMFFTDGIYFSAPAYPLEFLRDPTGAGDSFAGGLMGYLAKTNNTRTENIKKAIIYGSAIASFNAEGFGLENLKKITMRDIKKRYKEFENLVKF